MTDDPDNPPLTGKERWKAWGDRLKEKIAIAAIQARMLENGTQCLIAQGVPPDEAKVRARAALSAAPRVPIPTLDELDAWEDDGLPGISPPR